MCLYLYHYNVAMVAKEPLKSMPCCDFTVQMPIILSYPLAFYISNSWLRILRKSSSTNWLPTLETYWNAISLFHAHLCLLSILIRLVSNFMFGYISYELVYSYFSL